MEKIVNAISAMTLQELQMLQEELTHNKGEKLHTHITQAIQAIETNDQKICANCQATIANRFDHTYTLTFGPRDFRKKATLCGPDCMHEFMQQISTLEHKRLLNSNVE